MIGCSNIVGGCSKEDPHPACVSPAFLYPSAKSSMPHATMPVVQAIGMVILTVPTSPFCYETQQPMA